MDWTLLFAGIASGVAVVGTTSGFVYLIMRLITNPLKQDLDKLSKSVELITNKLKSESDLMHMINSQIATHERGCPLRSKGK